MNCLLTILLGLFPIGININIDGNITIFLQILMAYKEFIRDVLIYLGAARTEATKFATDLFSYEKRIAEITPHRYELLNPITTYNAISLSELKQTNLVRI